MNIRPLFLSALAASFVSTTSIAGGDYSDGIQSSSESKIKAPFDIVHAKISTQGNVATFHMQVSGKAGTNKPTAIGKLAGSSVFSYVWPTTLDSSVAGFDKNAGILALAVTAHADFDDTPLYDENADGNPANDGDIWHSHWVVLQPDEQCGAGALGVVDIPKGSEPALPKTWPGLPILLDSPGWDPSFKQDTIEVKVAFNNIDLVEDANYDGVTAGLGVNQSVRSPLLCVVDVMDIASGDLSLPGKVNQ